MINYVLGFAFSRNRQNVVLIEKQRPEWQKGQLNGVGGKVELFDDSEVDAMVREFHEETGAVTTPGDWDHFATMVARGYKIHCFRSFSDASKDCSTTTDEEVISVPLKTLNEWPVIVNLKWLTAMALDVNIKISEIALT